MLKSLFGLFSLGVSGYFAFSQELFPMFLSVLGPGLLAGMFLSMMLLLYQWKKIELAFIAGVLFLVPITFGIGCVTEMADNSLKGTSFSFGIMVALGSGFFLFPPLLANFRQQEEPGK